MLEYDKLLSDDKTKYDYDLFNKFYDENKDMMLCDGCGKLIGNYFSTLNKGHQSNPLDRVAIVHITTSSTRCRIRKCSGCGAIANDQELTVCPKCNTILPRNTKEEI